MIYYYAVTKVVNDDGVTETANYGHSPSVGEGLITLRSNGFVTFFLEITEDDYNLLIGNQNESKKLEDDEDDKKCYEGEVEE